MATNPFSSGLGLFGGETFADVGQAMRQEDELAGLRAQKQAPDYISGIIAKANEQMGRNIARQAGGIGSRLLQGTPMEGFIQEDPRLAKVRKRDADRQTLMKKYETLNADDKITTSEAQSLIDDLLEMGYLPEAKAFADIYQTRRKLDINEIGNKTALQKARNAATSGGDELKFEGPVMQDAKGNIWQSALTKGGKKQMFLLSGNPDGAKYNPDGATIVNEKEMGKLQIQDSNAFIKSGNIALQTLPKTRELLGLAKKIKSGGLAANINEAKRFLGVEPKDEAEFRSKSQRFLVENLKRIMGARPTDKDLEELSKALANLNQSEFANVSIITDIINKLEKEAEAGIYFSENPGATVATYNNFLRTKASQPQGKPDPLNIR